MRAGQESRTMNFPRNFLICCNSHEEIQLKVPVCGYACGECRCGESLSGEL